MRILFFLPVFLISSFLLGQSTGDNALSFPSANNSFLGKKFPQANVSIDPYTGTAQVTVPICNLPSRQLNIPVSLNYVDGRGVRVQEYASQVGLGWQLNAGGSISRVVRGFPDEENIGYLGTGQWGQVVYSGSINPDYNNFITTVFTASPGNLNKLTGQTEPNNEPIVDGEPDIFFVKTPFFNFQFVFDQNGHPVFPNSNGYQILPTNFINSSNYTNSSFEVIDPSGNQFYFGNTVNSTEQATDSIFGQISAPFITSWYLTKIVSFNSQDVITFNYTAATASDIVYNYSWMEAQNYTSPTVWTGTTYLSTGKTTISNPKFISNIVSSLGEVDFTYAYSRTDDPSVPELSSIVTKGFNPQFQTNSTTLQTYNFNYSYFGTPSTDPNVIRLQLTGITLTGNTPATSTPVNIATFGYNTSASLPNRTLPVFDYWGYTTTMPSPIPADIFNISRVPNLGMAQAGILNSITTLLGGTWNISYALNTYNPGSGGSITIGGLRATQISQTLPTGESLSKTYQYDDGSGNSYGKIYSTNYNTLQLTTVTGSSPYVVNFSSSPYIVNDESGSFIGYTYVKETNQNGGYSVYYYYNFDDFKDIIQTTGPSSSYILFPTTSLSYKRGLLRSLSVYNSTGNLVSETQNTYAAQSSPVNKSAYGFRVVVLPARSTTWSNYGYYYTPVENYRLSQTVHQDFDQVTPANSVSTTTNYTYDQQANNPINNFRLVSTISTTDSKGQIRTQTIYHAVDIANNIGSLPNAIPMISGSAETNTISSMVGGNNTDAIIHAVDNRNNTINQVHNTYAYSPYGQGNNVYLANKATYTSDPVNTGNTLVSQQFFNFDAATSDLVSSSSLGGKSTAVAYGYNASYPVSEVVNAASTISYSNQSQSQTGTLNMPPNNFGSQLINFITYYAGTITIAMPPGSYLAGSVTCFFSFTLSGPSGGSGNLCNNSASGYTCSAPNTVSFSNMPAGNYTLSVSALTNTATTNVPVTFTYLGYQIVPSISNEFFFEGFEQNSGATPGNAHTGNMYWNGNYTVPFTPPNSRSYQIQYWNLSSSTWIFNQKAYTTNMILTGPVDDVRVFPKDALMTSYTYNPWVGKTSETDPRGRSVIYQYDGLNRLSTVRDQSNNILKQYDYEFQLLAAPACNDPESGSFQRACSAGYIGSYVTYTVPACRYTSYISKAAANQLAINDVNTNGQAYANNPANGGTCLPAETISYSDTRNFQYSVRFTNNSTGLIYNFTASANQSGTLGQVPQGTYQVYICPINNYTPNNNYTVFGSTQSSVICATFNNVSVNAGGSISFF